MSLHEDLVIRTNPFDPLDPQEADSILLENVIKRCPRFTRGSLYNDKNKTSACCQLQGDNPTIVPEILLRGKRLQRTGFEPEDKIWVLPFSELLIVIPQGEKK